MHDLYMHAIRSDIHASMQICMYMAAVGYKYSNASFVWLVYWTVIFTNRTKLGYVSILTIASCNS